MNHLNDYMELCKLRQSLSLYSNIETKEPRLDCRRYGWGVGVGVGVKRGVGLPNSGGATVGVIPVGQGVGSAVAADIAPAGVELPVVAEPALLVALAGTEFLLVTTVVLDVGLQGAVRLPA